MKRRPQGGGRKKNVGTVGKTRAPEESVKGVSEACKKSPRRKLFRQKKREEKTRGRAKPITKREAPMLYRRGKGVIWRRGRRRTSPIQKGKEKSVPPLKKELGATTPAHGKRWTPQEKKATGGRGQQ